MFSCALARGIGSVRGTGTSRPPGVLSEGVLGMIGTGTGVPLGIGVLPPGGLGIVGIAAGGVCAWRHSTCCNGVGCSGF